MRELFSSSKLKISCRIIFNFRLNGFQVRIGMVRFQGLLKIWHTNIRTCGNRAFAEFRVANSYLDFKDPIRIAWEGYYTT